MVGAEMPSNSDMIKWAEQGRLHTKYHTIVTVSCVLVVAATGVFTVPNDISNFNSALAGGAKALQLELDKRFSFLTTLQDLQTLRNKAVVTVAPTAIALRTHLLLAYYENRWTSNVPAATNV